MTPASVRVEVPATSANLGPGYDCLGLALEWRDIYTAQRVEGDGRTGVVEVLVEGIGSSGEQQVSTGTDNLVARALQAGLDRWCPQLEIALRLHCRNLIPHGRGLGSSSAAIVGGLALAGQLCPPDQQPTMDEVFVEAARIEGHPDNVAPAVYGGFTPTWIDQQGAHALRLAPHPDIAVVVAVPSATLSTAVARTLMPESVELAEAVFNASRTAVLSHAITAAPALLLVGTEDRLHQRRRAPAYPETADLVTRLRSHGLPAVVSGAGPSVLVLAGMPAAELADQVGEHAGTDWQVQVVEIARAGVRAAPVN